MANLRLQPLLPSVVYGYDLIVWRVPYDYYYSQPTPPVPA